MSRITKAFAEAATRQRKLLIPYITAGDPDPAATVPLMHALVRAGADILEIGVPFSDPMADGPVIQAACERALAHHVSLRRILGLIHDFRAQDSRTPVVLMGYLNPIEAMGFDSFARMAQEAGVDGVLIVDLTPEESDDLQPILKRHGLDCVYLVAPTTTPSRLKEIIGRASGYLYYVSLKGVTGSDRLDIEGVGARLDELRQATRLPLAVGFGIRDAESAARIAALADGVVVGSALVSIIGRHGADLAVTTDELARTVGGMREAIDRDCPVARRRAP